MEHKVVSSPMKRSVILVVGAERRHRNTVFDATMNRFLSTGFHTLPNTWNKYSLIANTNNSTFRFLFNDQLFLSPHPLPFLNEMFYVDGINLRAAGTLTS
jgi:hypothetical protein